MTDTATPSTSLMPARGEVLLPVDTESAQHAMARYLEISHAVLTGDDYQRVGRGRFVKRSGFQKLATFYTLSTSIVSEHTDRDSDGRLVRHRAVVRATHPSGRYAEGDGSCSSDEPRFAKDEGRQKLEHDLPATAVTRATNRAISNLVGFGQISAEEAGAQDTPTTMEGAPAWAAHDEDVGAVANNLVDILKAAGGDQAAAKTGGIGQAIFDECDGGIPLCVAHAINALHDAITTDTPAAPSDAQDATPTTDPPPQPAQTTGAAQ